MSNKAENKRLLGLAPRWTELVEELEAENERLEKRVSDADECIMEQENEIESLRAENQRLRWLVLGDDDE
jgi:uncharacterized protein (DUF342 family)